MKNKRLLRELGEIDNALIEEAAPAAERVKRKYMWRWMSAAACVALVATAGVGILLHGKISGDTRWPVKEVNRNNGESENGEIAKEPKWDEKTISLQYSELEFDSVQYSTRAAKINTDEIGELLGAAVGRGYDVYEQKEHAMNAAVYAINGISEECAVAAQFDGRTDYFVYANAYYQPETLGDFIKDLNLRETLKFGSVWYDYRAKNGEYQTVEFVNLEAAKIWEMLLTDESLKAVKDFDSMMLEPLMSVSVDVPILGYKDITLGVTKDGYIWTNILDTGKAFYLGTEKTEQFIDYVIENCEGYEIVDKGTGEGVPE